MAQTKGLSVNKLREDLFKTKIEEQETEALSGFKGTELSDEEVAQFTSKAKRGSRLKITQNDLANIDQVFKNVVEEFQGNNDIMTAADLKNAGIQLNRQLQDLKAQMVQQSLNITRRFTEKGIAIEQQQATAQAMGQAAGAVGQVLGQSIFTTGTKKSVTPETSSSSGGGGFTDGGSSGSGDFGAIA